MVWTQKSYHKSVTYNHPGEFSPENNCYEINNLSGSHLQSQVNCESPVDVISLWLLFWLVNKLVMLVVVCQLSRDTVKTVKRDGAFRSVLLLVKCLFVYC